MLSSKVAGKTDDTTPPVYISWEREQDLDSDIVLVKEWLVTGTKPKWQLIAGESRDLKSNLGLLGDLFLDTGLLRMKGRCQPEPGLVVPRSKVESIMRQIHQGFAAGNQ